MAVYRVDVLIEDPEKMFKWIEDNLSKGLVVQLCLKTLNPAGLMRQIGFLPQKSF